MAPEQTSAEAERVRNDDLYGNRELQELLESTEHFEMVPQLPR